MTTQGSLNAQLKALSLRFRVFGRAEVKELRKTLGSQEIIKECAYGYYQGGSGLLVATDSRFLLIDKRPFYLNLEEVRYEKIREVAMTPSWLQATLRVHAGLTILNFRSTSDARLHRMKKYALQKIEELQHEMSDNDETFAQNTTNKTENPNRRPYLDPAWRPHHNTILARRKPTKFYPLNRSVVLSRD